VSFWTAYLKANYPAEYMAALLTSVGDDKDKMAIYLAECKRMGIQVHVPDVNSSIGPFAPVDGDIRFGMSAVRNVGTHVVEAIVRARTEKGAFTSFADFMSKVELVVCNKRTIESLIKAGAFDSLGHTRRGLIDIHSDAVDAVTSIKRQEAMGQFDLFGAAMPAENTVVGLDLTVSAEEWDRKTLLSFEREMLGLYVSSHPLSGTERILRGHADKTISELLADEPADGMNVTLAGMLVGITRRVTKQGKTWASATLEDLAGGIEVLFFPNTYELVGTQLAEDLIVAVKGRVNRRDTGSLSVFATDLMVLQVSDADLDAHPPITLSLPVERVNDDLSAELRRITDAHPGNHPVHVKLRWHNGGALYNIGATVNPDGAFRSEIKGLLGAGALG
jgi:DNA polymerase III subunit alpha